MSMLYVTGSSAVISIDSNRCVARYSDGLEQSIPIETLESINILGQAQMTTQCVQECLKRGITVSYYSKGGRYFGRLQSTGHVNVERQRMQCAVYQTDLALQLSRKIINAKIHNQIVVLKRYAKSKKIDVNDIVKMMIICKEKTLSAKDTPELMGYEGKAANEYFEGLSKVIESEFVFHGRSRRPPLDEFNSMISLGYSVIMNEFYGKIEAKGLNPYFGIMHSDKEKHPTLASDLMEEWRAVIVDATVMSIINGHEISKDCFVYDMDEPGCYLTKEGIKIYLDKLERKMQTEVKYLDYVQYPVSFRRAMALQIGQLVSAIEENDVELYRPLTIR